jgi:hypothetical protein
MRARPSRAACMVGELCMSFLGTFLDELNAGASIGLVARGLVGHAAGSPRRRICGIPGGSDAMKRVSSCWTVCVAISDRCAEVGFGRVMAVSRKAARESATVVHEQAVGFYCIRAAHICESVFAARCDVDW